MVYFVFVLAACLIETGRFLNFYNFIAAMIVTPLVAVLALFIFSYRLSKGELQNSRLILKDRLPYLNDKDIGMYGTRPY